MIVAEKSFLDLTDKVINPARKTERRASKISSIKMLHVLLVKGSDQRENRGVWSNINTKYLVWRCGDGRSFAL
jgi:hypothetical protein